MNVHPMEYKVVPHNIELEQGLLGALLMNNDSYFKVSGFLKPEHFYEGIHQNIYRVAGEMIQNQKKCNPVTIRSYLHDQQISDDLSLGQYVARLVSESIGYKNAMGYGQEIYSLYMRRQVINVSEDVANSAYDMPPDLAVDQLVNDAVKELLDLETTGKDSRDKSRIENIVDGVIDETSTAYQNLDTVGIHFPLSELNSINQGPMEQGCLYGLLGGTKEGKSSLTAQIMREAISEGHPTLCLSYDQSGQQWLRQFAAQSIGIDANRSRRGKIDTKEFEKLNDYLSSLKDAPMEIIKCGQENAGQLCAYAFAFLQRCRGIDRAPLIITDHVGKITPYDRRADAGKQAGQTNQELKAFAGEHGCVWFNLIQRNSDGTRRANPRPMKRDVYGGEGAVADYDAIFYVYRAEKWAQDQLRSCDPNKDKEKQRLELLIEETKGKAEIGLIAHRFAPEYVRKILKFVPELTLYESIPQDAPVFGGM